MSVETADSFKQACKNYGFGPEHILPHGSYLINLASAKPELLEKSYTAFVDELKRCEMLGIRFACTLSPCLPVVSACNAFCIGYSLPCVLATCLQSATSKNHTPKAKAHEGYMQVNLLNI